jgi:hypothetical protein
MMPQSSQWIVALFALIGALLLLAGLRGLRRQRALRGTGALLGGGLFIALAALVASLLANVYTYQRLTYEQPVATLVFTRLAPADYQVLMRRPDGQTRLLELHGDEWELSARVLRWKGWANLLGLDARYRLDRLNSRYRDLTQARTMPPSVYDLADARGLDLWRVARRYPALFGWVDTVYGSATYLPMADGARFEVMLTQTGLAARPANEQARQAVANWH